MTVKHYTDLNSHLRTRFGRRIQKLTIDAGFSCPNRDGTLSRRGCIFCNANGSGTGLHAKGLDIAAQINRAKPWLAKRYKTNGFIAYFQSFSNTYAPVSALEAAYGQALADEDVVGLSIGTRPDCLNVENLDLLEQIAKKRMVWLELGLQSAHDDTLALINRGHDFKCFQDAVHAAKSRGLEVFAHIILGLPGESGDRMRQTAERISRLPLNGVKIHLLYVVKNTVLAGWHGKGKYTCLPLEKYAHLVCDVLQRLPARMVIQRLTGTPHAHELVAPTYALDRNLVHKAINRVMEERNAFQGDLAHSP